MRRGARGKMKFHGDEVGVKNDFIIQPGSGELEAITGLNDKS